MNKEILSALYTSSNFYDSGILKSITQVSKAVQFHAS
jgi:hypothetical protein